MASKSVRVALKDGHLEVLLAWEQFDGDDCFEDFRIIVYPRGSVSHVYEFRPCAVHAVRKLKEFISDSSVQSVGGGFRHPDIRTYDLHRVGADLRLAVKFEGTRFEALHVLESPEIRFEEEPYLYAAEA